MNPRTTASIHWITFAWILYLPGLAAAGDGVTFRDVAAEPGSALADYRRTESATADLYREFTELPFLTFPEVENTPNKWRGAPGVAILDHDGDGDLDLYVTNGPGTANSLFTNQLVETGALDFVDVGVAAGVAATDQDSSGVCFGDIDNDGDPDILVLSPFDANRLFENNGDGTFTDVTAASGLGDAERTPASCSFGDVDGDGLLDVVVANTNLTWTDVIGISPTIPFGAAWHNQLYRNTGGNVFADVSVASGIEELKGFPPGFDGSPSVTWAIAMVDYDLDGDADILHADDGDFDRGYIHVLRNDGFGVFTDVTVESGMHHFGNWMGLSFGDLDGDRDLDLFGTNVGDWNVTLLTPLDPVYLDLGSYQLGERTSRWFLGSPEGTFTDPGVGDLVATPFGWGTSMADYDNDGDTDIVYHGGLLLPPMVVLDNPGVILRNDGAANFTYDFAALAGSTDHLRRSVHGVAAGDLDDDGFTDLISVSDVDVQDSIPLFTYNVGWGSPLDGIASYQRLWSPTATPGLWTFTGSEENVDGTLSVEISSGDNGNGWVKVRTLGTVGLTAGGAVNRDGIGAVVSFTAIDADSDRDSDSDSGSDSDSDTGSGGKHQMFPVLGGSSYASQDSLEVRFGLGDARRGRLEVLWPGGVRNRLDRVRSGERILFPEIPCSYDGDWVSRRQYRTCVRQALDDLVAGGFLSAAERARFFTGAMRAFDQS